MRIDKSSHSQRGFTLLEILIALSIFTVLSMILLSGLKTVMNTLSATDERADELRRLQHVLLLMKRAVEQAVDRPITNAAGQEEAAFLGTRTSMTLTYAGAAGQFGQNHLSGLKRVRYFIDGDKLYRETWNVLDQPPNAKPLRRLMLQDLKKPYFAYLNRAHEFKSKWPDEDGKQKLPFAVRFTVNGHEGEKIEQLYSIVARESQGEKQKDAT